MTKYKTEKKFVIISIDLTKKFFWLSILTYNKTTEEDHYKIGVNIIEMKLYKYLNVSTSSRKYLEGSGIKLSDDTKFEVGGNT